MKSIFSKLYNFQFNSKVARGVLGCFYRNGKVYAVPFGPLRGIKMRYYSDINFHALLGLWELASLRFLSRALMESGLLKCDSIACDVGANIGMYSLWLSRRCIPEGKIYAFEIAPTTLERLHDNLLLNNIKNVEVIPAACADRNGPVEFFIGRHHHTNSLNADWSGGGHMNPKKLIVNGITLDDFFYGSTLRPTPDFIKMDIEGGGVFALKGCTQCCEKARPLFYIESHTPDEDSAISVIVTNHDYAAFRIETNSWVKRPDHIYPHPDGIWGTVFLCPLEKRGALVPILGKAG